jgi:hypothetical protein
MLQEKTDIHGAMRYISDIHDRLANLFLENRSRLPSWGEPIDSWVARYVDRLGSAIRGHDCWCLESWRYFKEDGFRIQRERWVELLPPEDTDGHTPPVSLAFVPDHLTVKFLMDSRSETWIMLQCNLPCLLKHACRT